MKRSERESGGPAAPGGVLVALLSASVLMSCSVGPDYEVPDRAMPETWSTLDDPSGTPSEAPEGIRMHPDPPELGAWWRELADPTLEQLVLIALNGNPTLQEAIFRVVEGRSLVGARASSWFPLTDLSGGYARRRESEQAFERYGIPFGGEDFNDFSLGLDISWELDFVGRIRRLVEASRAELGAASENVFDVIVLLVSDVATSYIDLRAAQERRTALQARIEMQEATLAAARTRRDAESAPELDAAQARTNLETTRAELPRVDFTIRRAQHRLAVLLGVDPGDPLRISLGDGVLPAVPESVATGLPADLVRNRPDLRRAERELAAETARIGVAKAQLWPQFTIGGTIGYETEDIGDLLERPSGAFGLGPSFRWQILHFGRIENEVGAQEARERQAWQRYEVSVLRALEEVENARVGLRLEQERVRSLEAATESAARAVELASQLYESGEREFHNLVDAQRTRFVLDDALIESRGQVLRRLVQLHRALGGGWRPEPRQARPDAVSREEEAASS